MVNILVAAAALAAASPTAAPPVPANANPAIFVVRDADTVVYIFGTFHALDGQSEWFNDQVKDAFDKSNELVLETLIPETPGPIALRAPLRVPSVTASASFLATTRMAISAGKTQGMQVGNGADMVLRHEAERTERRSRGSKRCNRSWTCSHGCRRPRRRPRPKSAPRSSRVRWTACRRPWATCSRHGSAATRGYS